MSCMQQLWMKEPSIWMWFPYLKVQVKRAWSWCCCSMISQLCPSDCWHLFWDCHNLCLAVWVWVVEVSTQLCRSPQLLGHGEEPGPSLQLGEDYPWPFMALRDLWAVKSEAVMGEILQIHLMDICSVWFHMVPSPLSLCGSTPLCFHKSCIRLFPPS